MLSNNSLSLAWLHEPTAEGDGRALRRSRRKQMPRGTIYPQIGVAEGCNHHYLLPP